MSGGFSNKGPAGGTQLTAAEELWVQTGEAGVLLLAETTAPAATANVGKLYVKSSDSALYFKNDSGSETAIGAGGVNVETPTGAVDGANVTFTVANTPKFLIIDNSIYFENFGYSFTAPTITVNALIAPITFIRSIY